MRGCLTFILGILLGIGLMLYWWPRQPAGEAVPQGTDVQVRISDHYLSRLAQHRASGLGVSNVTITSVPPSRLIARGTLTIAVVSAPISLQFQPVAENGTMKVHLIDAEIGNIPLPGQLIPVIGDSINSSVGNVIGKRAVVEGVRVLPTGLEIAADYR